MMEALESPAPPPTAAPQDSGRSSDGNHRKPRKSRGRGLRTTTGCTVCRKRHMKCDEAKPFCGPCIKSKRECVYAGPPAEEKIRRRRESGVSDLPSPPVQRTSRASISSPPSEARRHVSRSTAAPSTPPIPWLGTSPLPVTAYTTTATTDDSLPITRPQSRQSDSFGYGTEIASLRWLGLLAGDSAATAAAAAAAADGSLDILSPARLGDAALAHRYELHRHVASAPRFSGTSSTLVGMSDDGGLFDPFKQPLLHGPATCGVPCVGNQEERQRWQKTDRIRLTGREGDCFRGYVTGIATWIDLLDPHQHYATLVPHMAQHNEGLMKAILALGAWQLATRRANRGRGEGARNAYRDAAVRYHHDTVAYLQANIRFPSYTLSPELLATSLVVSQYGMIGEAGHEWKHHLQRLFQILRYRQISAESGSPLERATWWAWLRQDIWAAFRERRRCLTFFKPEAPYPALDTWQVASRIVYILAQSVNYASDEEKQLGEANLAGRIARGNELLQWLDEWRRSLGPPFQYLPDHGGAPHKVFQPLWVHPSALGTALQMFNMARILLLINQPAAGGFLEYCGRDKVIIESIDIIAGIALRLSDNASRLVSTQCLFAAGLYCHDEAKRTGIVELIIDHGNHTGWPTNTDLMTQELHMEWAEHTSG